ncbi:forkhead box protein M1 isoform X2 [Sorex araneus]|uniref:forkhead box protein M1 isoform X2 n=1 Tax=Sorex araneus TaxID=42254 RepID=UPI002433519C|nr:forkhead box protein M1 isoform X2 [Sorex araneus]
MALVGFDSFVGTECPAAGRPGGGPSGPSARPRCCLPAGPELLHGERRPRFTMRTSPRRPLILKRRRLPLPAQNAPGEAPQEDPKRPPAQREAGPAQAPQERAEAGACQFPAGIRIINHPTVPDTQVVAIPSDADIQSIIAALTAKGKESGSSGPTKFILVSCGGGGAPHPAGRPPAAPAGNEPRRTQVGAEAPGPRPAARDGNRPRPLAALPGHRWESCAGSEAAGCALNVQWHNDRVGSCPIKQEVEEKENRHLEPSQVKVEEAPESSTSWPESVSERPPYSYMAMIQFAINSTERKRMTLKDIYAWIEDHFPYFKHIAKPGWKNSIRHNLSLHDMFVRETSGNGKVSFWTIHPSANRYLTLDQVFKPLDPGAPQSPEHLQSQQKRPHTELRRNVAIKTELPLGARRKMKPLLPRVSSYLVPIQFPANPSLVLQPSVKVPMPLAASLVSSELARHGKRVRIAPKVLLAEEGVGPLPTAGTGSEERAPPLPVKEEAVEWPLPRGPLRAQSPPLAEWPSPSPSVKEEASCSWEDSSHSPTATPQGPPSAPRSPARRVSEMLVTRRREQRDRSRSRRKQRLQPPEPLSPPPPEPPASSTPSKAGLPRSPGPWRLTPPGAAGGLQFSPVRTPRPPELSTTPLRGVPLFDSPRELLHPEPFELAADPFGGYSPSDVEVPQAGSPEPQDSGLLANRSLTEGLVLDTMNDSLSKILLDISFPGLDEDPLGPDGINWAQILPELR